jgi:hypothetical protein
MTKMVARPELGQSRPAQELLPVLVAPFVAPFVVLLYRSYQFRAKARVAHWGP